VAFSPDGQRLHYVGSENVPGASRPLHGTWDLSERRRIGEPVEHPAGPLIQLGGLAVSADGHWALILWSDKIEVWPLPD
jgi:hypothetical protein